MKAPTILNHRGLIALKATVPFTPGTGEFPESVSFLKWGENKTAQGTVIVGEKTLAVLSANLKKAGFDEVVIDFNHNTVPGSDTYKGEPAQVAATHCKPTVTREDGIVFLGCQWTPEGKANAHHYPDLSPTIQTDENGEVIFIHSGAICRNGATEDLRFFSANPILSSMLNLDPLRKLLHLSADATDADINAAVDAALSDNLVTLSAKFGIQKPEKVELTDLALLAARLDDIERNNYLQGVEMIREDAASAGRVIPADWLPGEDGKGGLPLAQLRKLSASLPVTVPLEQRTPDNLRTLSADPFASADQREIARQLGIKPELLAKA